MFHRVLCLFSLFFLPTLITSQSSCGGSCSSLNDCAGQLICINGKCNDDPDLGTHTCGGGEGGGGGGGSSGGGGGGGDTCQNSGTLTCPGGKPQFTFACSPPVSSSTPALLTDNDFSEGGDGGGPSECDDSYHENTEQVVALSTGWYAGGSRCGKMIRIVAQNGQSTTAKVVDECDSEHGCDEEHAGQGPCGNNVVDASNSVWNALGLDINKGVEHVTWSMA